MTLPDEDPDLFEIFVECIYSKSAEVDYIQSAGDEGIWMNSARLYVLAEKYDVREVQFAICQKLFTMASARYANDELRSSSKEAIEFIYDNTGRRAPIRKVLVDCYAFARPWSSYVGHNDDEIYSLNEWLPRVPDFAADLALATRVYWRNHSSYSHSIADMRPVIYMQSLKEWANQKQN